MDFKFLSAEANKPQIITIIHCPKANKNNNATENTIFADSDAIAIIVANIGEEHGVVAKAKAIPINAG